MGQHDMKTRIKWVEGVSFVGETGSGHAVVIDGAPEHGGRNLGMRPMEMVLTGAAACTAFDVVLILKKGRQPVADCVVDGRGRTRAGRAEGVHADPPRLHGRRARARPAQVERAVKLSKEKYCSATIMLAKTAEITYEIVIIDGDRVPDAADAAAAALTRRRRTRWRVGVARGRHLRRQQQPAHLRVDRRGHVACRRRP